MIYKLIGYDFHRQKPIGNYIADFRDNDVMNNIEGVLEDLEDIKDWIKKIGNKHTP